MYNFQIHLLTLEHQNMYINCSCKVTNINHIIDTSSNDAGFLTPQLHNHQHKSSPV